MDYGDEEYADFTLVGQSAHEPHIVAESPLTGKKADFNLVQL